MLKMQLGFHNGIVVDSNGRSGGLGLFWNDDWKVDLQSFNPGHIDTLISSDGELTWRFTGFYGHPEPNQRSHSWNLLKRLSSLNCRVVMGDFNEILHLSEKEGGLDRSNSHMLDFNDVLDFCGLRVLKYKCSPFTWNNRQSLPNFIQERLDRAVTSISWSDLFPETAVLHLDYYGYDHRLLKLEMEKKLDVQLNGRHYKFKFEPFWRFNPEFKDVMADFWKAGNPNLIQNSFDLHKVFKNCGINVRN